MRIGILTQYYPPEIGAPQNRLSDLAKRLAAMGHEVTVLTAMPNYLAGEIFDGYKRKAYHHEVIDGISVHRSWIFATRSRGVVPRLWTYFSFVFSALVFGLIRLPRADVLFTESPPLFLGVTGYVLARVKRARFLLNVADLWPRAAVELNVVTNPVMIRSAERLERWLYRRADLITGQTQGIVEHIRQYVPREVVHLLTNGTDLTRYGPEKRDEGLRRAFGLEDRFVVGYGGLHGPAQALHYAVEAGVYLRECPEIVVVFFGDGPEKAALERLAREKKLDNVRFFPVQPQDRMPGLISLWDVALVSLQDNPTLRGALPSKMFEAMGAGVPILLSAPAGEATRLVEAADAGLCVTPEDAAALAQAMQRLYQDEDLRRRQGRNARCFVEVHYNRETIARQFVAFLKNVPASR